MMLRPCAALALAFLALGALAPRARASPAPLDCCGDGTCALECTEGCAAAACAACCTGPLPDPCAGFTCPSTQCTDAGTCSGASICSPETPKAAGATCTITAAGDGACDGAGVCAPNAPAGSWVQVSVTDGFACGVDTSEDAWCWGTDINNGGGLGQGGAPPYPALPLPARVVGGHSFTSITVGRAQVCALTPVGAAYCWGSNNDGQLGDGSLIDASVPTAVDTSASPAAWTKIAAGFGHTCAIAAADSTVWCWGGNLQYAVGVASPAGSIPAPVQVTGPIVATDVSAGNGFSCAIVAGGVLCWGNGGQGQLGSVGSAGPTPTPQAVVLASGANPPLTGVTRVTAGDTAACAYAVGGTQAWCWGSNSDGQLGNGAGGAGSGSGAEVVDTPAGVSWAQLVARPSTGCGLSTAGAAYCWGYSLYIGVEPDPTTTEYSPVPVSPASPSPQTWARLSEGFNAYTTVAITRAADGATIYAWGYAADYSYGNGVTSVPTLAPLRAGIQFVP